MKLTPNQRRVLEAVVEADSPLSHEDIAAACEDYQATPWTFRATEALEQKGLVHYDPDCPYYWVATEAGREAVR